MKTLTIKIDINLPDSSNMDEIFGDEGLSNIEDNLNGFLENIGIYPAHKVEGFKNCNQINVEANEMNLYDEEGIE